MAAEIQQAHPDATVKLVQSSGGAFEVTVDGTLIYSKLQTGRHAKPGEVLKLIGSRP
ncbi:MAG: SelT/SelW/SelH family protein [Gemmatimonadetes bacterium]|nr:SelT/SelW/SelH family protein [Gemmatimonadota bacterium]